MVDDCKESMNYKENSREVEKWFTRPIHSLKERIKRRKKAKIKPFNFCTMGFANYLIPKHYHIKN